MHPICLFSLPRYSAFVIFNDVKVVQVHKSDILREFLLMWRTEDAIARASRRM